MKLLGVALLAAIAGGTPTPKPHIYAAVTEGPRLGVVSADGGRCFYPTHAAPIFLSPDLPEVMWSTLGRKLTVTLLGGPQNTVRTGTQTAVAYGTHGRIYYASGKTIVALGGEPVQAQIPRGSIGELSPAPDGTSFAVSTPDLYVVTPTRTTLLAREVDPLSERPRPAWSPDGAHIAYDSGHDLWVVAPDGTGRRRLTRTPHRDEVRLTWSPDGTRLAFTRNGSSFVATLDGQVTPLGEGAVGAWSPDGTQIALIRQPNVVVLPASGGAARVVVHLSGDPNRNFVDAVSWLK